MLPFYTLGDTDTVPAFGGSIHVRIGENARKCVVFFGVPGEGAAGEAIVYGGTGFLAGYDEAGLSFSYLVTCRHVAMALKEHEGTGFYVRLNTKDGGSLATPLGKIDWRFPTDPTVDLAVTGFHFDKQIFDHIHLRINGATDRRVENAVGIGDDLSVVGLFHPHAGTKRNIPLVHSGHIAVLADATEPVPMKDRNTDQTIKGEVYLIEAQTLDGCSGSPVFIHETVTLGFVDALDEHGHKPRAYGIVKLMGIYCGSWDGEPGKLLAVDRRLSTQRKVPIGMGTVVPIDLLIDVIEGDSILKKEREAGRKKHEAKNAATQDSGFPAPPASGENPMHREDFNSLLAAAVQKPEQEGQT